ncbi:MAG: hypothetical protein MZV64_60005 [Ignavibacteriales bacterium]|nr:hypothetical protein [Ignavibacteriales bacterium]
MGVPSRGAMRSCANNANFYASRDPFEDMSSFGSRTTSGRLLQRQDLRRLRHARLRLALRPVRHGRQRLAVDRQRLRRHALPLHARRLEGHLRYGPARLGAQQRHAHLLQPRRRVPVCEITSQDRDQCGQMSA